MRSVTRVCVEDVDLLVTPSTGSAIIQPETQSDVEGVCRVGIFQSITPDVQVTGKLRPQELLDIAIKKYIFVILF